MARLRPLLVWTATMLLAVGIGWLWRRMGGPAALSGAERGWLGAALGGLVPLYGCRLIKWRRLARRPVPDAAIGELLGSIFIGNSLGLLTPGRVGELGGRAWALTGEPAAAHRWTLGALAFAERFALMPVTMGLGLVGLASIAVHLTDTGAAALWPLTLLFGGGSLAIAALGWLFRDRLWTAVEALDRRFNRGRLRARLGPDAGLNLSRRDLLALIAWSLVEHTVFTLQFYALLRAFGPAPLGWSVAGVWAVMAVKSAVPPVMIGDLGVREAAAVGLLGPLGIPAAHALSASLLLFAVNLLIPALVGLPLLARRSRR